MSKHKVQESIYKSHYNGGQQGSGFIRPDKSIYKKEQDERQSIGNLIG